MKKIIFSFALVMAVLFSLASCQKKAEKRETLWVYTSLYKHVVASFEEKIKTALPDIDVKFFQAGSEKILVKLKAEQEAGGIQADVVLISDPFWYEEAKEKGLLGKLRSERIKGIPEHLRDSDDFFVTARVPVMVIAYNRNVVVPKEAPTSFQDLLQDKWLGKIAIGNPLESGSNFTAVANLSRRYGWEYYEKLRKLEPFCAGGNSTVLMKIQSKEFPVGVVLLENILEQRAKDPHSSIVPVYPKDGVILIPSPIAILKKSEAKNGIHPLVDFVLSDEGQKLIVEGFMYSPFPNFESPKEAPPFAEVLKTAFPYDEALLKEVVKNHEGIRSKFSQIMFKE